MEATASAVQNFADRSREFNEFSKGIVLYNSDVNVEGSWKIGTIEVPEVTLDRLGQTEVDFNPEVWIPGLDVIVDDIQKKVIELERLLDNIDNRLQGKIVKSNQPSANFSTIVFFFNIGTIMNGTHDAVEFDQLTIDGSLLIKQIEVTKLSVEKLNGLHFDDLVADIVRRDSDRMIESLKVMGTLTTDALTADRVNDIVVKDVVIGSDQNITISGNLTIGNAIILEDVTVGGTVNGIDLSEQLLTSNDTHGNFVIMLYMENVISAVLKIYLGLLVFLDNFTVGNLSVNGYLNGVDAVKVLPNVVANQTIDAHLDRVHFDHLVIDGDLDIKSGIINDIDIAALNSSALRLDENQIVNGSMVFTKVA